MMRCAVLAGVGLMVALTAGGRPAAGAEPKKKQAAVAGKADVLRHVPKKFATLTRVDADRGQVELHLEGEPQPRAWTLNPDAEIKVHGWWGRLEQLAAGDRVWVWLAVDRRRQPTGVLMLADELSQQDLHGLPHTLIASDAADGTLTLESPLDGRRVLATAAAADFAGRVDQKLYVQSAGPQARLVLGAEQLEQLRGEQQAWLRARWQRDGLPGTVTFLHPLGGEMEVMLDHEAMRWGRYLKTGDAVTLAGDAPISASVRHVRPWRERTQLRLVTKSGIDQADLVLGQRIQLRVPAPPPEVQDSDLPTDIGRATSKAERIEWFLASVYCPCKIGGDRCTGMFYTLASCNVNACGMPNHVGDRVGQWIDEGLTDEQIWHELQKARGPLVLRQHLLH